MKLSGVQFISRPIFHEAIKNEINLENLISNNKTARKRRKMYVINSSTLLKINID
jgi:hypothetical protein